MEKQFRTIFIWDIHWCFDEFELLLAKLNIQKLDKVYCLWDIINKWPKSYELIDFFYENKKQYKLIMGNHELEFLNWINDKNLKSNSKTYENLKEKIDTKNPKLINFLKSLPKYIEKENFIALHWGLIPWKKLADHKYHEITYLKDYDWKPWYEYYTWNKKIIYWHRALQGLNLRKNTVWIDSWCVYGWFLSAYILETQQIISQKALFTYSIFLNKN